MNFKRRILISLSFAEPCSVADLWKILSRDLLAERIDRVAVYKAFFQLRRDGLVCWNGPEQYELTGKGRKVVAEALEMPLLK